MRIIRAHTGDVGCIGLMVSAGARLDHRVS